MRNGTERECKILGEKDSKMYVEFESTRNGGRSLGYCFVEKEEIIYKMGPHIFPLITTVNPR